MKLVADWRRCWRWHSTQAMAVLMILPLVWVELPGEVRALVPLSWQPWVFAVIAFGGLIGRLRAQNGRAG